MAGSNEPSTQGIANKRIKSEASVDSIRKAGSTRSSSSSSSERSELNEPMASKPRPNKATLGEKKWQSWSKDAHSSPFPDFARPTENECRQSHRILQDMHGDTVRKNFEYTDNPGLHYPYVMDALIVATLSQATSWANAQRAMKSMTTVYGSAFAYQKILDGGEDMLRDALRPGGMQNRKAKMVMQILLDVRTRHGAWDLNHLFNASDDDAVKELISYKGVGPKSALCILSIYLQRDSFAVDTHIYRISGLWGWRPEKVTREKAQAHLDARIPNDIKFALHYLLIVHGRECEVCRGNGNPKGRCEYKRRLKKEEASS
jgi:endonuclease-3